MSAIRGRNRAPMATVSDQRRNRVAVGYKKAMPED